MFIALMCIVTTQSVMDLNILEIPLKVLRMSGLDPTFTSWITKIKCLVVFLSCTIQLIIASIGMSNCGWTLIAIVPEVETAIAAVGGLMRWFTLFFYKNKIAELIKESETFWKIKDVDPSNESGAANTKHFLQKTMKIYVLSIFLSGITAIVVTGLFSWGEVLPFVAWFPRDIPFGYEIFYCIETFSIISLLCMLVGAVGLFAAFCGQLIAQFKILNKKIENTAHLKNTKDYLNNLQDSISYHLKLIEFGKKIGNVFFNLFLGQYLMTVLAFCIELFMISEKLDDIFQILRFISFMSTLMGELAIYCFLAEAVMDESMNTGSAVYFSDWYLRDIKEVGIYIKMIIIRASNPVQFSGGGLFLVGRILWFNIIKMSVSVFTLLTALQ